VTALKQEGDGNMDTMIVRYDFIALVQGNGVYVDVSAYDRWKWLRKSTTAQRLQVYLYLMAVNPSFQKALFLRGLFGGEVSDNELVDVKLFHTGLWLTINTSEGVINEERFAMGQC